MKTSLCLPFVIALASAAGAQQLIAVDSSRSLFSVDPATGAKTSIGTVSSNAGTCGGLAYDSINDIVYLTSSSNDSLFTVDLSTGNATLVGAYGSSAFVMHGLEFDSSTGTLYGSSSHDGGLYTIDTTTGVATLVGVTGLTSFVNLVHDSNANVMYASNSGADSFYSIDRATGAATLIGALVTSTNPNGLAYDPVNDLVYMLDNSTDDFYTIDVTTGVGTVIGDMGAGNLLGLMYVPSGNAAPVVYCTAGVSTNGCVASIGFTGTPSVSAASGFVIDISNVEGGKQGLLFYGVSGPTSTAWGSGGTSFLCVKSPTQRMGIQSSGGTAGLCDGAFSQDWSAFITANPFALGTPFSAGDVVHAQAWYRDPPAVKTTNLSNGLEFTLAP